MPFNITFPRSATIGVRFRDAYGVGYTPSSAWVTLTYLVSGVSNSSTLTLVASGGRWSVDWSSAAADAPQNVALLVYSSCGATPADSDIIRLIDP